MARYFVNEKSALESPDGEACSFQVRKEQAFFVFRNFYVQELFRKL